MASDCQGFGSAEERLRRPKRGAEHRRAASPEGQQSAMDDCGPLPSVSVIMAVYNGERYIAEAVESVLGQTHEDFEFVIVNDGSTDSTGAILAGYAARDRRVRVIDQANADQPASLNRALAAARNDWVAVLDADDVCVPHRLETQLRALRRLPPVRVLGSYAFWMDQAGRNRGVRALGPITIEEFEELAARGEMIALVHPSVMMHRPTILAFGGYDPGFGAAADMDLWSRVSHEHVVVSLPEPLVHYRVQPESMSATRFFEQQLMLRWSAARQRARRQGNALPTLAEYRRSQGGRFALRRLVHLRKDWVKYLRFCRRLESWRGRRLRAVLIRALGMILSPSVFARQLARRH